MPHVPQITYIHKPYPHSLSAPTMESVPTAFLDSLCATLTKDDLKILQKVGGPWTLTVVTHYSKRREFTVSVHANHEGTQVEVKVLQIGVFGPSVNLESIAWSKYDRIIQMDYIERNQFDRFGAQPLKMSMEGFRTKVLPVLTSLADDYAIHIYVSERYSQHLTDEIFSRLIGRARSIGTGHAGGKSFLKSPNFVKLNLHGSDLTVDLDMLIIMVERFFNGDLKKDTLILGKLSEELRDLNCKILRDKTLPLLDGLSKQPQTCRFDNNGIFWNGPDQRMLFVYFPGDSFVQISHH
uniref:FTH domain-containing protein n=1 Tax=Steinernema glaseri TaxID=37863 RepID=A0A1I8ARA0_9BILA